MFNRFCFSGLLFCLVSFSAAAQDVNFFIVIGAFDNENNAKRMVEKAGESNMPAKYGVHTEQKRYYVFVRLVTERTLALETMRSVREEGFKNAWIFTGNLHTVGSLALIQPLGSDERVVATMASTKVSERKSEATSQPALTPEEKPVEKEPEEVPVATNPEPEEEKPKPAGKPFMFKVEGKDGRLLKGTVRLQESDRATQFTPFNSNEIGYVIAPKNRGGKWFVVCDVVGYRAFRMQFDYNKAANLMDAGPEGEFIFPVAMIPVKRGDYIELDRVKFFTNSDILVPESRAELDELVAMMVDNSGYKIRLHGHTNGDQSRDIVSLGESNDLFAADASNKKYTGSAKELSTLRAETVKRYMVENGVEPERVSVKGEGGKQRIFEGTLTALNDRVEVEVVKH
jgi:outer membrane protein OmpA-like peptidoglycan-associated protein